MPQPAIPGIAPSASQPEGDVAGGAKPGEFEASRGGVAEAQVLSVRDRVSYFGYL